MTIRIVIFLQTAKLAQKEELTITPLTSGDKLDAFEHVREKKCLSLK